MATIAWTSNTVPGSLSVTANPADTVTLRASSGRCARCERWPHEGACPGVFGEPVHLSS